MGASASRKIIFQKNLAEAGQYILSSDPHFLTVNYFWDPKRRTELICRPTNFYTRFLRPTKESSVKTRITSARPAFNYFWITTFWSGRRILVSSFLDSFSVYISVDLENES